MAVCDYCGLQADVTITSNNRLLAAIAYL